MKRILCFSLLLLLSGTIIAQTQQGVSYQYNGKKARTPLGNVTISYDNNRRTIISNEKDGSFRLALTDKKMGDRIGPVTVKKREMMVFNQQAVDEWSVRKEPLMLILCNADAFEKQKENLINIGRREAKKKYDKQKAELEAKLNASQIKQAEYEAALDKAYEELERLQKNIGEYADLFARIDESEVDTIAQQAVELFNIGEVEKAIKLFEQGNYMEKLKKDNRTIQQAVNLIEIASQSKKQTEQLRKKHIQSIEAQIKAYQTQGEVIKAQQLFKEYVDEMNTIYKFLEYATFCSNNDMYEESFDYYEKMLEMAEDSIRDNKHDFYTIKGLILDIESSLYYKTGRTEEFFKVLDKAIQLRRNMATEQQYKNFQEYPYQYTLDLAKTLYSAGFLYDKCGKNEEANKLLCESVFLYRHIATENPSFINMTDYYEILEDAGEIIIRSDFYNDYERLYLSALETGKQYLKVNPSFESYVSSICLQLGKFYFLTYKDELGFRYLKEILDTKQAADDYSLSDIYIEALYLQHSFYTDNNERKKMGYNLLRILKNRMVTEPEKWKKNYCSTLGSQSFCSICLKEYSEAEQLAREGLAVDSTQHWIATNLAAALLFQGKYDEAEQIYRQYKDELKDSFLDDFKEFSEAGVIPKEREEDVRRIKQMLNE